MSQFAYPNAGLQGSLLAIWDEEKGALYEPCRRFGARQRGAQADILGNNFTALWPVSQLASGDPGSPLVLLGGGVRDGQAFEPSELGIGGSHRPYFIRGQCKDSGGAGISGALVQGFLTVGDVYVGEVQCDSDGNYEFPTVYLGAAHYLVAYRSGAPDITGATVNSLIPVL